jgi:hypothetical protein
MILALFVVISVILIYGMLLINVQQKSFEIGIKRMVGCTKTELFKDIIIQTLFFAVPGIILGFILCIPALRMIYYYAFKRMLGLDLDPNPTYAAIYSAIFLGLFIPLVSSVMPIKVALSKNLNDALDFDRSQTRATIVQIVNSNNKSMGATLIFGVISTIYGITIYVMLPEAMLSLNFGLLLKIFFLILIGLLLGLVLITMNFQFIVEIAITKMLFWWESKAIKNLISKNLGAHRARNSSTTLVYALSLSFLIL